MAEMTEKRNITDEEIDFLICKAVAKADELMHHYDKLVQLEAKEVIIVAELLQELKEARKMVKRNYHLGYHKAIDDFREKLLENSEQVRPVGWASYSMIVTCDKIVSYANDFLSNN